ncbi:MAG: histidinol dehydrogenase [Spirochaetales bacterium]|uniref:Histidinol dehydrogenase n=1 Tax=Candidatus Thalassospirochaeta sargassi TaxID=3119039 RepID=A0AAJ1IDT3_9SPIO|nr:histidinol dehydrogenase [Spirochaetales bacterium]
MKINIRNWKELNEEAKSVIFSRSELNISGVSDSVAKIIAEVGAKGDAALREFTLQFDKTDISNLPLLVSEEEYAAAEKIISPEVKAAVEYSIENVQKFHMEQKPQDMSFSEIRPGIFAGEKPMPIESVGLYVPRGRGSFPSMLYMLAVPAAIAGVERIVVVTPPNPDGTVEPACLYAAKLCGVHEVYRIGGAQAIAALAVGTESIKPVKKLSGPGSMYVTAAKRLLSSKVDPGLPAGPSESIVLADGSADPVKVALDLMIEAEHGSDSSALLITPSAELAEKAAEIIAKKTAVLPEPRKTFVEDVMSGYGGIIITRDIKEAADIVNQFAPEHLQIQSEEPFDTLPLIKNAGEILLGENTPFSIANYSTGANAVLPTGGGAATYSAVSVRDFIKYSSVVYATQNGMKGAAAHVKALADYEGFITHGNALKQRGL